MKEQDQLLNGNDPKDGVFDPTSLFQGKKTPIKLKESDLGSFQGKNLTESDVKRYFKGDEYLETDFALNQSVWDRMLKSAKITGANIVSTGLGVLAEIPDMISTGDITGENAPIAKGLFDWRNEIQKENTPYETIYDKENPFKSVLLPGFLTGSSKGWGSIVETAAYGIGAGLGIGVQELGVSLLTGGTGTIPVLANSLAKLVKLSNNTKKLANYIEEGATALKGLNKADELLDISQEALKLEKRIDLYTDVLDKTRDLYRTTAMSYSEAQMEALEGKSNFIENQKLEYRKYYGYDPTGKDLDDILKKSSDVYQTRFTANMLLLGASNYVSNKIFFDGLTRLKSSLQKFKNEGIEGVLDDAGNLVFKDNSFKFSTTNQWWEKGFGKGLKTIGETAINTVKNTPLALSEGIEEGSQFIIDKATNNYFGFDYKTKEKKELLNVIKDATKELFTTQEGLESMLLGVVSGTGQQVTGNLASKIKDIVLTNTQEGYIPYKQRKQEQIKKLNELADLSKAPEIEAVNVNSVFGTLDKKFKNTSKLVAASGALDQVLGNKELERRVISKASFDTLAPFVEMGMSDVVEEMFKYRIDSLTEEEWNSTGITKTKQQVLNDFNAKLDSISNAYKISNKEVNPYEKNSDDYFIFENTKNAYAFTLYQIDEDVKSAKDIKQRYNKYFDVLTKFNSKSNLNKGIEFLKAKTKEYTDRISLLEQAEKSEYVTNELRRTKKILSRYEDLLKDSDKKTLTKEKYIKFLDDLVATTDFELNIPTEVTDVAEHLSAIQDYDSIQERIKENLNVVKLMQGGSWQDKKKFVEKKIKEAQKIAEKLEEKETTDKEYEDFKKGEVKDETLNKIADKVKTETPLNPKEKEIAESKSKEVEQKVETKTKEEERQKDFKISVNQAWNLFLDELITGFNEENLTKEEKEQIQNAESKDKEEVKTKIIKQKVKEIAEPIFISKQKELNELYYTDIKNEDFTDEMLKILLEGIQKKEDISEKEYKEFIDTGIVKDNTIENIADKIKDGTPLTSRETEIFTDKTKEINEKLTNKTKKEEKPQLTPIDIISNKLKSGDKLTSDESSFLNKTFNDNKTRVSYALADEFFVWFPDNEAEGDIRQNYKESFQEMLFDENIELTVGEDQIVKNQPSKDVGIIIISPEGKKIKPIFYKGKQIGWISPSNMYEVKSEFKNTKEGKELQRLIDMKDLRFNSKTLEANQIAQSLNTKNPYKRVKSNESSFTKFLFKFPEIASPVLLDRVVISKTKDEEGNAILKIVDNLNELKLSLKEETKIREFIENKFLNSKSLYKDSNGHFIVMINKNASTTGDDFIFQPINLEQKTLEATQELESYFDLSDEEKQKIRKKLVKSKDKKESEFGWNDFYVLIDSSKYNDLNSNVGDIKKTPNTNLYIEKNGITLSIDNGENIDSKFFIQKKDDKFSYSKDNQKINKEFNSIEEIIKDINPNFEFRKAKPEDAEKLHSWILDNSTVGESTGRIYFQQQLLLTPKKEKVESKPEINTEVKQEVIKPVEVIVSVLETKVEEKKKSLSSIIITPDPSNPNIKKELTPEFLNELSVIFEEDPEFQNYYQEYLNNNSSNLESFIIKPDILSDILLVEQEMKNKIKNVEISKRNVNNEIKQKLQEYLTTCK